jgi:hypothetical protein
VKKVVVALQQQMTVHGEAAYGHTQTRETTSVVRVSDSLIPAISGFHKLTYKRLWFFSFFKGNLCTVARVSVFFY